MQVGDKRQATMLSVVAVGAVAFVIFQLVPKADARQPRRTEAAAASTPSPTPPPDAAPNPGPASGTRVLKNDPFGDVAETTLRTPRRPRSTAPKREGAESSEPPRADRPGTTALPPLAFDVGPAVVPVEREERPSPPKAVPVSVAGRPSDPPTPVSTPAPKSAAVRMVGVVQSSKPVAILAIDGDERTFRVGDEIVPGIRITAIGLNGLLFRATAGATLAPGTPRSGELAPGEEIKL